VELVVLAKAVPRSEAVRFDPERRTLVRSGVELVLNPFDQRALRVALELREAEDRVTVVSLGPPAVAPLLREARALGADRALLLSDGAFAGSDVLATSAALASAVRPLGPSLVLAGSRSTDSDTGLVGPEVGARLGLAVATGARSVRRAARPGALEVVVDTPTGSAEVAVPLPALVSVGEKIAKPLALAPEQFSRVLPGSVETVSAAQLGLSAAEVGAFGSPTVVDAVEEVAPVRVGRTLAEGPVADRVREAMRILATRLEGGRPSAPPLPWPPAETGPEVMVLVSEVRGSLDDDALGLLTYLRRALPAHAVRAAVYGPAPSDRDRDRFETAGALGGYVLDPRAPRFDASDVAAGLAGILDLRPKLTAVVATSTGFGREVAGQLAAVRGLGVVGDATGVRSEPEGRLAWSKPSFGGTTVATVRCRSSPVVATMPGGLATPALDARPAGRFAWTSVAPPAPRGRVERRSERDEPGATGEVGTSDVVVAVGTGVGGPDGIAALLPTVRRWGAVLVGTRRVVDAGWLPTRLQVGLTGRLLAPRLAVLLGVRGAPNHMVGWARAGTVVAVNRDPEAPVFRAADVGIVGTVEEVVPELAGPLEERLRADRPRPGA